MHCGSIPIMPACLGTTTASQISDIVKGAQADTLRAPLGYVILLLDPLAALAWPDLTKHSTSDTVSPGRKRTRHESCLETDKLAAYAKSSSAAPNSLCQRS